MAASGADFLACSPYKFLGPALRRRSPAGRRSWSGCDPDKLLPVARRGAGAVRARDAALRADGRRHRGRRLPGRPAPGPPRTVRPRGTGSSRRWPRSRQHEDRLRERVEEGLARLPGVTLHSRAPRRTPTLLATFERPRRRSEYPAPPGRARRQRTRGLVLRLRGVAPARPGRGRRPPRRAGAVLRRRRRRPVAGGSGGVRQSVTSTQAQPHGPSTSGSTTEPVSTSVPRTASGTSSSVTFVTQSSSSGVPSPRRTAKTRSSRRSIRWVPNGENASCRRRTSSR